MEGSKTGEKFIKGISASAGIAIGEVVLVTAESMTVAPKPIQVQDVKKHLNRFKKARTNLAKELGMMSQELTDQSSSEIIDTQLQIIQDPEIEKNVLEVVEHKLLSVDFAIYQTFCMFIERLKESGSDLFRQRIVDLEDLRDRFVAQVSEQKNIRSINKGSIIIAREISPTDLVSYYESGAVGLVMEKGGITSHAAIIAKSLGLPCIVSADKVVKEIEHGEQVILDADKGVVLFDVSHKTLKAYSKKAKESKKELKASEKDDFETTDGHSFRLMANIEFEAELPEVKKQGVMHIGLLRTESLLFGNNVRKKVEEQEAFYEHMVSDVQGQVTIRLFDIGGDKSSVRSFKEANPFLGWRGIRLLLDEKQLLRNQLRAILTVAGRHPGKVKILVPMVSVLDEVYEIRKELENMQGALVSVGIPVDENVPIGLMVEVPSVALSAYQFAKEVDFMSIGTNDLTQYTLAVDRGNERICTLFQHLHPSVLRLIKMTLDGCDKADIRVGVCGELAGDEIGAACLFGLGIQELSMVPNSIPKIGKLLSSRPKGDFEELAEAALDFSSSHELKAYYKKWLTR